MKFETQRVGETEIHTVTVGDGPLLYDSWPIPEGVRAMTVEDAERFAAEVPGCELVRTTTARSPRRWDGSSRADYLARAMTRILSFVLLLAGLAAVPATASAGAGFTVPSRNTTCGLLTAEQTRSRSGLYCSSTYIKQGQYDGRAAVELHRTGKARRIGGGNDLLLYIGGFREDGTTEKRPVLRYGKTWRKNGYRCVSRSTGLTCRRGAHGFFLSRESQRYF